MGITTDGIEPLLGGVTTTTEEGITSLNTIAGRSDVEVVHIDAENISTTKGFIIVDLSDTTNWPHTETGHIDILFLVITIDPDTTYAGDIEIGFLSNVDATNGDFNGVFEIHMEKKTDPQIATVNFGFFGLTLETDHWFGPTEANDATWQTDLSLQGPDGNTSFPSGDGDLVMKVVQTAGAVSVGLTIGYSTMT